MLPSIKKTVGKVFGDSCLFVKLLNCEIVKLVRYSLAREGGDRVRVAKY